MYNIYVQIPRNLRNNRKCGFENFFRAHPRDLVFLVVCIVYIKEIRG